MMNGFITPDGPLLVQVLKTNNKVTWNSKLMQDSVRKAILEFKAKYGDHVKAVFLFDHS